MTLNHSFWRSHVRSEFSPQLSMIVEVLESRLLPTFAHISDEADQAANDKWDECMSRLGTGDEDPGDFAETAIDAGIAHYSLMSGIRQGLINMVATGLYHAFEQQILEFHRREILPDAERNNSKLYTLPDFEKRLLQVGIEIRSFQTWSSIEELRLLANTVKHADGPSANKLHDIRPQLFEDSKTADLMPSFGGSKHPVFQPMVGQDLYVQLSDIHRYLNATLGFWDELLDELGRT